MASREDCLGFKPQKELTYSRLLPYANRLDDDSNRQLAEIKANLGRAILLKDSRPGCLHWVHRLSEYICLHGRKFSKEDHVAFIKVFYELVVMPKTEFTLVQIYSQMLIALLKKRDLISPDDLQLPWKPLYLLYEEIAYSSYEAHGLVLLPGRNAEIDKLALMSLVQELGWEMKWTTVMSREEGKRSILNTLKSLIRLCRPYFPLSATQEMLDEWRPLLCPFDVTILKAMTYFEVFLPTLLHPEHHDKGFKLWFTEIMDIWQMAHNCPPWESSVVWLLSRLAMDTIGYIDWEPYISVIFTKLLRSFNLPVGSCQIQIGRATNGFEVAPAVNFITAMLGAGSSCQNHLSRLMKAIESYYHPSNSGRWNLKLQRLLYKLPSSLVNRLHKERFKKQSWEPTILPSHCLTEDDITQFVESVKPCVLLAMFSKTGSLYAASAMQYLSILRPELLIPPLLERLYPALETLTEPHRLIATMHCFVSVSRSLVRGGESFPEGPQHVLPLLTCSLPGIDPNDFKKCMVTFQFIFAFVTLVPLVDCSSAVQSDELGLNEREQELCLATREFEDFVLQFMDRCFALIENSTLEHTTRLDRDTERMNSEEGMLEVVLTSTFTAMLMQCSAAIYQAALSKLQSFISGRVLETKVAGKLAANMCRAASKVNSQLALKTFLPHLCRTILSLTVADEVLKEEMLDTELLFSMLLLSEIVRCNGRDLLVYQDELMQVLHRTLHLTSKPGYLLAHSVLRHVLKALTLLTPLEFCSTTEDLNQQMTSYLPIRDWGKSGDVKNLDLKWHIPTPEEKVWAQKLLQTFLIPELEKLKRVCANEETMTREEIQRSLSVILDIILGAGGMLPLWEKDPIQLGEGRVTLFYSGHSYSTDCEGISLENGQNVRGEIALVIHSLLEYTLKNREDDTKSLFQIIQIYQYLLFFLGINKDDFEARWKSFHFAKKAMENKLLGKKQHIRSLLIDRTQMQHEMFVLGRIKILYTSFHEGIMNDLLQLSTSHYSEVRAKAQIILNRAFQMFTLSYSRFIPQLKTFLTDDPNITHEQLKGALHVILGSKTRSFLTKHNWKVLYDLWPVVIQAQHSEKPSVIKLVDEISEQVQKNLETLVVEWKWSDQCLEIAKIMWNDSKPKCNLVYPSTDEMKAADSALDASNAENLRLYHELIEKIVDLINAGNLRWRHHHLALVMLSLLLRYDIPIPAPAVKLFAQNLIHDSLSVRKLSISAVAAILKQQKREHKKMEIDPYSVRVDGTIDPTYKKQNELQHRSQPGHRTDNEWLLYHSKHRPITQEAWDSRVFVNKTHYGYYTWPKPMLVYAPSSEQPQLNRKKEDLSAEEAPLYEFLSQENNIRQWITYLSLEDRKGKDKFDAKRFVLFKGVFRNFGVTFLPLFHPHLERLVAESQESSQRCAAEIIAGLIRGSKHWPFHMVEFMAKILTPILKVALSKVTIETVGDWGTCIATASESGDPNRLHWLMDLLMEEPMRAEEGSFVEASRLYVLQGGIAQQEWRVAELLHKLLDYLKPYLTHPFQNVRVRLGSLLTNIFLMDVNLPNSLPNKCPQRKQFVDELLPQLMLLESEMNGNSSLSDLKNSDVIPIDGAVTSSGDVFQPILNMTNNCCDSTEKQTALALMKTVCKWLIGNITRSMYIAPPEFFKFLPLLCQLESNDNDEELKQDCMLTLACLGQAYLTPANVHMAILTVVQISKSASWRARASSLSYLQVMVFCNIFSVMKEAEWVSQIQLVILNLLEDERVEVREMAGVTLGGFFHCEFIQFSSEFMTIFKTKCSKKLAVGSSRKGPISPEAVIQRHAGILGLCAYVNAYPYDVPEKIPDILMILGEHLNDPQPIPLTIKKTLSNFRRTHHDNWRDHKLKFSDDQLAVLTDLLVSPSYYA